VLQERLISYYRYTLNLPNWQFRVNDRQQEETNAAKQIECIQALLNINFEGAKVLVVGVGTGNVILALYRLGTIDYGIDASEAAIETVHLRCKILSIPLEQFLVNFAENLPYEKEVFDLESFCRWMYEHFSISHNFEILTFTNPFR
jgi:ubiquinone/menaquinone biosynthesis C-methylase UbiE